jgi:hypothetical protein
VLRAATGVLLVLCAMPSMAMADFDPPNGTLIQTNLPGVVSLVYSVDAEGICAGPSTSIAVRLTQPDGSVLELDGANQPDWTLGPTLSAVGIYQRAVVVTCAGVEHLTEQGSFELGAGEPEALPPGGGVDPGGSAQGGPAPGVTAQTACKRARAKLALAQRRLAKAKRAVKRKSTVKRRRGVRSAQKTYRSARARSRAACSK